MVRSIINQRGNAVPNQFVITTQSATYFQSYDSVVAKIDKKGNLILSKYWDYSNTTLRHLYNFLRDYGYSEYCSAKEMRKAIKDGKVLEKDCGSLELI